MIACLPEANWGDFQLSLIFINIFDMLILIALINEQKEGTGEKKVRQTFGS